MQKIDNKTRLDHLLRSERMASDTIQQLERIDKLEKTYLTGLITLDELADII